MNEKFRVLLFGEWRTPTPTVNITESNATLRCGLCVCLVDSLLCVFKIQMYYLSIYFWFLGLECGFSFGFGFVFGFFVLFGVVRVCVFCYFFGSKLKKKMIPNFPVFA